MCPTFNMEKYHKLSHHNFTNRITMPDHRCTDKECVQSNIVEHQSGSGSHAPLSRKGSNAPTQIPECAPEPYHMDVDSNFFGPSHESMEVNSAQPNIVAGPSQITFS